MRRAARLSNAVVTARTLRCYSELLEFLREFCRIYDFHGFVTGCENPNAVAGDGDADLYLSEFIQFLYDHDLPKYRGTLAFAAVLHFWPRLRGHLAVSRRCLKGWDKLEPAVSVFPCPVALLRIIIVENLEVEVSWEYKLQVITIACLLFVGLLRPEEARGLRRLDLQFLDDNSVVLQVEGKSEIRRGCGPVGVSIKDPLLVYFLRAVLDLHLHDDFLFEPRLRSASSFGRFCSLLAFPGARLTPYSFKRGGASHLFELSGSYDRVVQQGRWASVSTARIYISDARASQAVFLRILPEDLQSRLRRAQQWLRRFAAQVGMGGSSSIIET